MGKTCRGVRGATVAGENSAQAIVAATKELLIRMVEANGIETEDVGSVFFTVTADLDATFPAEAAHELGWREVPLMCTQEIPVPGSLQRCIRILILWNTPREAREIEHIYLGQAQSLRAWANTPARSLGGKA